jgi:hypothetical protein
MGEPADPTNPFATFASSVAGLVKHVGLRVNRFAEDVARDAGEVARDAEALARAAQIQWTGLREGARATPRLGRVVGAGTKLLALWRPSTTR